MTPETLLRAQRTLAGLIGVLVLVLALIAGRAYWGPWDIEVHGWVGNAAFTLAVVNLALTMYRRAPIGQMTIAGAIAMLMFAQVGLGYVGREQVEAVRWHIPNGVLLMALSTYQWATLQARVAAGSVAR